MLVIWRITPARLIRPTRAAGLVAIPTGRRISGDGYGHRGYLGCGSDAFPEKREPHSRISPGRKNRHRKPRYSMPSRSMR